MTVRSGASRLAWSPFLRWDLCDAFLTLGQAVMGALLVPVSGVRPVRFFIIVDVDLDSSGVEHSPVSPL